MVEVLTPAGLHLTTDARQWIGEAEVFSGLGLPLLSLSGAGIDFHTPDDTPERATTPAAMRTAADAVVAAVAHFRATQED